VSVVCCQVEVSATSWSLVQRSPTDCGVSQMCVIVKPRRNVEAQAHIRLSSHTKKNNNIYVYIYSICECVWWAAGRILTHAYVVLRKPFAERNL
jgi:hypothetical protein